MANILPLKPADVQFIAVHCSATPGDRDIGRKEIDIMHRQRGFVGIGYHYVIRLDGTVELGRDLKLRGAHIEDWNHCSVGVCLVGGVDANLKARPTFNQSQLSALKTLLYQLKVLFPKAEIKGHRDFPNVHKDCPSFDVRKWWAAANA